MYPGQNGRASMFICPYCQNIIVKTSPYCEVCGKLIDSNNNLCYDNKSGDKMIKFQEVYDKNKKLDSMFDEIYGANNKEIIRKNKLELLVELGELTNETRCFKYWSKKEANMDLVKDEYADCIIMTLCFFNLLNISLDEEFTYPNINYDNVDLIAKLYKLCSEFYENEDRELLKNIFVHFIILGHQLNLSDDDIISCSLNKIERNYKRFEEGF